MCPTRTNPASALASLRSGNQRFVAARGQRSQTGEASGLPLTQAPIAAVLGCSDARVPIETVFDQSLGELFVIRVAGNVVTPVETASVEFALTHLGIELLVVLGHSGCGAVTAAVDACQDNAEAGAATPALQSLVDTIRPAVERCARAHPELERDALIDAAVTANVEHQQAVLQQSSALVNERVVDGTLRLTGACYALDTGLVTFFDG